MKSIMKKAIALVIAVAVLIVPMAVSAESYDENIDPDSIPLIAMGQKVYNFSPNYDYAILSLKPDEVAEYTIVAKGSLIGVASYNGMFVTTVPSAETVNSGSVVWKCTDVNQTLWIAVSVNQSKPQATLIVTKKEIVIEAVPETIYENVHTPTPFTFNGDADKLEYVDTEDDVVDVPVLGDDGFYHLNSKDGPVLYADLDDSLMNLVDANSYGQLGYVEFEGDKAVNKIDFYDAFEAYHANADANTLLYPLTEDLIAIYKMVGEYRKWYGEEGWVGGTAEDCWMFACYYSTSEGGSSVDNNGASDSGSINGDSDEDGKVTYTESPETGSSSASYIAVMLIAASAVFILKKKAFN